MTRSKKDNPGSSEEEAVSKPRNRRQILALGGAAAAAAAVAAFRMDGGKKAHAGHGTLNDTSSTTDPAIHGDNTADGPGVEGTSQDGAGVVGSSQSLQGVRGESQVGPGVFGIGDGDIGVFGIGFDGVGGFSPSSVGGRFASGSGGIGLRGVSPGDAQPAVEAASGAIVGGSFVPVPDGGLALDVIGKARFSSAAMTEIPRRTDRHTVLDPHVQETSMVLATLHSNPGKGVAIAWVEVATGGGSFKVHLSDKSKKPIKLCYFVIN